MSRIINTTRASGFTLIELLLAMSAVAMLLIIILTSTIQITRVYNKGITLKQVNQAGATLGDELSGSLKAANAPLTQTSVANGRLCLGSYSYVWNLKGVLNNKYSGADASTPIGIVQVADSTKDMCNGTKPVPKSDANELLRGAQSGAGLQLLAFTITQAANSGSNYVYTVNYTVATDDSSLYNVSGDACNGGSGDEFCALNAFTFDVLMRVGGGGTQ